MLCEVVMAECSNSFLAGYSDVYEGKFRREGSDKQGLAIMSEFILTTRCSQEVSCGEMWGGSRQAYEVELENRGTLILEAALVDMLGIADEGEDEVFQNATGEVATVQPAVKSTYCSRFTAQLRIGRTRVLRELLKLYVRCIV